MKRNAMWGMVMGWFGEMDTAKPQVQGWRGMWWVAFCVMMLSVARGEGFPKVYDSEKDETAKRLAPEEAAAGFRVVITIGRS